MLCSCFHSLLCRGARRIHIRLLLSIFTHFSFACVLGLTPFLQVSHVRIPTYTSLYLPLGSNSLFAVCCAFVYPRIHPLICFLGLTPFLHVFCICTPTCAFLYLFFGSNSLLADFLAPDAHKHAFHLLWCLELFSPIYSYCMTAVLEVFRSIPIARSALRILYSCGSFYTIYHILLQLS